jgi:serine/threonine-protein kinase
VEGNDADARSDIFAFGAIVYEMVTGKRAFEGKTQASVIAAILERDPERIVTVQPASPRALDVLVRRCLAKNRDDRWQSVADLAWALTWIDQVAPATLPRRRASRRSLLLRAVAVLLAIIAAAAVGALATRSRTVVQPTSIAQFQFPLPEGQVLTRAGRPNIAIAPDGHAFAYVANNQLFLRTLGDVAARPITGTAEDVNTPVFSPDGKWIAFNDAPDGILKKVPVGGGVPVAIATIDNPFGASWLADDRIVLGQGAKGIATVSSNGGPLKTIVSAKAGEILHNPQVLPDGDHVLFTVATSSGADRWDRADIVVQSLSSGARKTVITGGADARYISTGHLVYAVGSKLLAVRFDPNTLSTVGGAVALTDGVLRATAPTDNTGAADFAFAQNGTMVSVMAQLPEEFMTVVVDRDTKKANTLLPAADLGKGLSNPRVSPDGKQVALMGGGNSVWLYELSGTNSVRRLTFDGSNGTPLWTRDSRRVVFWSNRGGDPALYWQPSDGSAPAELLARPAKGSAYFPLAVTPDGKMLVFEVVQPDIGDIWVMSLEGDRTPRPLVAIPGSLQAAVSFSPDGRWFAYSSDETGRSEIFVQSFPTTGAKYQITNEGGNYPVWSPDGRHLFYLKPKDYFNQVMSVDVTTGSTFAFTSATALGVDKLVVYSNATPYDVTPDGRRFLFAQASSQLTPDAQAPQFRVTLNWFEELKTKVPVN